MASHQRIKEVGEYNNSVELSIDGQLYRIVVMYGPFRVNYGTHCEDEPMTQAFVIRTNPCEYGSDDLIGYHMFAITPGLDSCEVMEEALIVALDQACFSEKQKEYVLHWVIGEQFLLKSEIE